MPCDSPMPAYRTDSGDVIMSSRKYKAFAPLRLPCQQCMGCRLDRSRTWAVRISHEAQMHKENCFVTLTYANPPENGSLEPKHIQDFFKRLRQHLAREARKKLGFKKRQRLKPHQRAALRAATISPRYFHCGEYGEKLHRPHYHAVIFGYDFPDKILWKRNNGFPYYVSELLSNLWGHGFVTVGELTFESAAYVARYVTKKINGPIAKNHYERLNEFGEYVQLVPEYATMSRRPGIGKNWFAKYHTDVFPSDEVILNGKKFKTPKYYDRLFDLNYSYDHNFTVDEIKIRRHDKATKHLNKNTPERRQARVKIRDSRIKQLKRAYEYDS